MGAGGDFVKIKKRVAVTNQYAAAIRVDKEREKRNEIYSSVMVLYIIRFFHVFGGEHQEKKEKRKIIYDILHLTKGHLCLFPLHPRLSL